MQDPETVQVQREKSDDNPTGIVVINKADLVEDDVVVGGEEAPAATTPEAPAATETTEAPAADDAAKPWAKK